MCCGCTKMAKETTEAEKMQAMMKRSDKRIEKMALQNEELGGKVKTLDKQLDAKDKENKTLRKQVGGKLKENKELKYRAAGTDLAGSALAQTSTFFINWGIDAIADKYPDGFFSDHRLMLQSVPHSILGTLWYLAELVTMKKQTSVPKQIRMEAAKLFSNLGYWNLSQAIRNRGKENKKSINEKDQAIGVLAARNQSLEQDVQKLRQQLQSLSAGNK